MKARGSAEAFALALEHTQQVAVPAEVKTQVMKHAALLDAELLSASAETQEKQKQICRIEYDVLLMQKAIYQRTKPYYII